MKLKCVIQWLKTVFFSDQPVQQSIINRQKRDAVFNFKMNRVRILHATEFAKDQLQQFRLLHGRKWRCSFKRHTLGPSTCMALFSHCVALRSARTDIWSHSQRTAGLWQLVEDGLICSCVASHLHLSRHDYGQPRLMGCTRPSLGSGNELVAQRLFLLRRGPI